MYQKLHIKSVKQADQGPYYCRGKLGDKVGWRLKSIIVYVGKFTLYNAYQSSMTLLKIQTHNLLTIDKDIE